VAIEVFVADEQSARPIEPARWMSLAEAVLSAEGVAGDAELSVLFVEEDDMAQLHQRFLGEEGPTDVLAFSIDEEPVESGRSPDSGGTGPGWVPPEPVDMPTLLGDVVICPSVAWRNAPDHAGTYEDELALLVVHGILHLLGMDHVDEQEATAMEQRERELLERYHRRAPSGNGDSSHSKPAGEAGPREPS
jgi:probable rRNA maturation factor